MGRDSGAEGWCILRTSPARTLPLAASLVAAGVEAWTPTATIKRRVFRGKKQTKDHTAALTPTFVFARATAIGVLRADINAPRPVHPPFSLFRHLGEIKTVSDREIERLRQAERKSKPKGKRQTVPVGSLLKPTEGPYTGMEGVVQRSDGKFTLVAFGGWMNVQIETFTIRSDDVHALSKPDVTATGIAA